MVMGQAILVLGVFVSVVAVAVTFAEVWLSLV